VDLYFFNRSGIVYSSIVTDNEGYSIVIDAVAKYDAASEFAPLKEAGLLCANTLENQKQLTDFVEYGTPFTDLHLKGNLRLPSLEEEHNQVSSQISLVKQVDSDPVALILISGDKHLTLKQSSRTYGRKGAEWIGEDTSHAIQVQLRTELDSLKTTPRIIISFESLIGQGDSVRI
jgi:hypothetical protein